MIEKPEKVDGYRNENGYAMIMAMIMNG